MLNLKKINKNFSKLDRDSIFRYRVVRSLILIMIIGYTSGLIVDRLFFTDLKVEIISLIGFLDFVGTVVMSLALIFWFKSKLTIASILIQGMLIFTSSIFCILHGPAAIIPAVALTCNIVLAGILFKPKGVLRLALIQMVIYSVIFFVINLNSNTSIYVHPMNINQIWISYIIFTIAFVSLIITFRKEYDKRLEHEVKTLDITSEKLQRTENRYNAIVEDQVNLICILDKKGRIFFVNKTFCEYYNKPSNSILGKEFLSIVSPEKFKDFKDMSSLITLTNPALKFENKVVINGENKWTIYIVRAIYNNSKIIEYQVVGFDITTEKQYQEQLILSKEEAENSLKIKQELMANISHELRTPLNLVVGMSHLLDGTDLSKTQKKYMDIIKLAADDLLDEITQILDFSKIESNKVKVNIKEFNVRNLISKLVSNFKYLANVKNIDFNLEISDKVPKLIKTDPQLLSQILNNIIDNSIKFTQEGKVSVDVDINETSSRVYIEFIVRDTGIGIDKNFVEKVFESFTQASSRIAQKFGGTGLGLTIAKKLVTLLGGTISIKSKLNEGTQVSILLPIL